MRQKQRDFSLFLLSPSSRRAWIEMESALRNYEVDTVALLAEGVDRNRSVICWVRVFTVALLAEGVDRNTSTNRERMPNVYVALLAEGVDRNICRGFQFGKVRCRPPRGGRG